MAARIISKTVLDSIRVPYSIAGVSNRARIGNRDVVGHGMNGEANYLDRPDFPMPAIRFKENTSDVMALREKEKGDWRNLSTEEKKALYRASFCQTFAEFQAPTGNWKKVVGIGLMFASLPIWLYMLMKIYVFDPLPESFSEERRKAQLKRILDLHINPVDGLSSKWDYENNRWK